MPSFERAAKGLDLPPIPLPEGRGEHSVAEYISIEKKSQAKYRSGQTLVLLPLSFRRGGRGERSRAAVDLVGATLVVARVMALMSGDYRAGSYR